MNYQSIFKSQLIALFIVKVSFLNPMTMNEQFLGLRIHISFFFFFLVFEEFIFGFVCIYVLETQIPTWTQIYEYQS